MRCELMLSGSRGRTRTDWLDSAHSFSYGAYYDESNTHFGPLLACNEDVLAPGTGFAPHPHRELEIVTWVIGGELLHTDTASGENALLGKGHVQVLSAGGGVTHSEHAGSEGAQYVQMWVQPDQPGRPPRYRTAELNAALEAGGLVPVTSQPNAALFAARIPAAGELALPDAPMRHLFMTSGNVVLASSRDQNDLNQGRDLYQGDAVRMTGVGAVALSAVTDSEILVWLF